MNSEAFTRQLIALREQVNAVQLQIDVLLVMAKTLPEERPPVVVTGPAPKPHFVFGNRTAETEDSPIAASSPTG